MKVNIIGNGMPDMFGITAILIIAVIGKKSISDKCIIASLGKKSFSLLSKCWEKYFYTVKAVYKELGYNEAYRLHRMSRFLYKLIAYNENSLLKEAFGRTDLFVVNGINCIYRYAKCFC